MSFRGMSVKILVVGDYPRPNHPSAGMLVERCVTALKECCERVEVIAHRPYFPCFLSSLPLIPRWRSWASIMSNEVRDGISIHRPAYFQIPRLGSAYWVDGGAFFWSRRTAREVHRRVGFDAIISFDLLGAGGLAWRLGYDLGIPATGWAFGGDVRVAPSSSHGRAVIRTLRNLDLVFYQSHELLEKAAGLLEVSARQLSDNRHIVLAHGIPDPPQISKPDIRKRIRAKWGMKNDEIVVLYLGRILRQKGMLELIEAVKLAASRDSRIKCVLIGSRPGDDSSFVEKKLREFSGLRERLMLVRGCRPDEIWENLCGADIFLFPSYNEGMPNSLLEAMAMGVPAIAFAIPAIRELECGTKSLLLVPPLDCGLLAEAILHLAARPDERILVGEKGRALVLDRFMIRKRIAEAVRKVTQVVEDRRLQNRSEARAAAHTAV